MQKRVVSILVLLLILGVTLAFYFHWKVGYSSDTALIGLMAKSILERGERPIFVWSVGYQGILLEAYATALVFKVFGISPITLNLFNMICLWGLFAAFYYYLKNFLNSWIALLATTLLTVSSIDFYRNLIRTQPNYTETYLFGILLFWISHLLIRHFYVDKKLPGLRSNQYFAAFGFIAGFAIYTYGQSIYFLAAICLQLLFIYVRDALNFSNLTGKPLWEGIFKRKWTWIPIAYFSVQFLAALVVFFFNLPGLPLPGKTFHFNPAARAQASLVFFGFVSFVDVVLRYPKLLSRLARGGLICLASFIVGISPQLYFKWVLHGVSLSKTTVNGDLNEFVRRLSIAFFGNLNSLNAELSSLQGIIYTIAILAALCAFSFHCWKRAWDFMLSRSEQKEILSLSPILFFPWIVLPIFSVASSVVDRGHARYALVLLLFHVVAISWAIVSLISRSGFSRVLGYAFLGVILANNAKSLSNAIESYEAKPYPGEPAIAELKKRGLKYGYANYWLAYTIDFSTAEGIVLEPTSSNYSPHYGPLVRNEKLVALVDYEPRTPDLIAKEGFLTIHGISYQVLETWKKDGLNLSILKKVL